MARERYETGKAPRVTIAECSGDIVVRGWSELAVMVKGEHTVEESAEALTFRAHGSLKVWVPSQSQLVLQNVAGDAIIKGIEAEVQVNQVMGDAALKSIHQAQIGTVYGDLAGRSLDGTLKLEQAMGDVALRNVVNVQAGSIYGDLAIRFAEGNVHVTEVMGDAILQTIRGEVKIARVQRDVNLSNLGSTVNVDAVQGDVRLKGGLASGKHHLNARGDIVVRWPAEAPLNVLVTAGQVQNRLKLEDVTEKEGQFSGRIGDGDTTLVLEAQGRVILNEGEASQWESELGAEWTGVGNDFVDIGVELSGLGEQITSELDARMAELSARMEQSFGAVQRVMRQADRMRRSGVHWAPPPPPPPKAKKAKPSPDEQLKILNMLEKGIISVEEAEKLLKALEE